MSLSSALARSSTLRRRTLLTVSAATVVAAGLVALPHAASAYEYQRLPSSSPQTWSYDQTLSTLTDARDVAANNDDAARSAATAAADALSAAKTALADALAQAQAATNTQIDAKATLDKARTRDDKAKAQSAYNRAIGARYDALAVVKSATTQVSKTTAALKSTLAAQTKTAAALTAAQTRVSRFQYMYGTSADAAFTKLQKDYIFSGTKPDPADWGTYDSTKSTSLTPNDPRNVSVRDNVLQVSSVGRSGSGVCLCTQASRSTTPFGRFEIRAKIDQNADHGAAILLWPVTRTGPESGEIDLAEFNQARTQANFALHYDAKNLQVQSHIMGDYTDWHTYRVDWNERGVAWYIDNNLFATVVDKAAIPTKPFQFVVQAGANSSKASNTSTTVSVSSVKVYAP